LRQAILSSSSGDTINFDPSVNGQTILLTSGQLLIDKNLTITGPGANLLVVSGNLASRVFNIGSGFEVTISGLTISSGRAFPSSGGGILNNGSLAIIDSTLSGNQASFGSGIDNNGSLSISDSTVSANVGVGSIVGGNVIVGGSGAGIRNSGLLTITSSNVIGNAAGLRYRSHPWRQQRRQQRGSRRPLCASGDWRGHRRLDAHTGSADRYYGV
jgi:hypothetical protein